jgi:hypothetical protein
LRFALAPLGTYSLTWVVVVVVASGGGDYITYSGSSELAAAQYTAVKTSAVAVQCSKKCHPNFLLLPPDHHFSSREQRAPVWPLSHAAEFLVLPIKFSREEPPAACLPSPNLRFNNTTKPACEQNLRTISDPAGLLRDQSLATAQPRKPTDNALLSQIRAAAMTHETATSSLPCRRGSHGL